MRRPRSEDGTLADQRVTIYLTAAEKKQAKELAANLSLNEHFRRAGLKMKTLPPALQMNRETYLQMGWIRTHLNQIVRACNQARKQGGDINIDVEWLKELEDRVRQLQLQVLNPNLADPTTIERQDE